MRCVTFCRKQRHNLGFIKANGAFGHCPNPQAVRFQYGAQRTEAHPTAPPRGRVSSEQRGFKFHHVGKSASHRRHNDRLLSCGSTFRYLFEVIKAEGDVTCTHLYRHFHQNIVGFPVSLQHKIHFCFISMCSCFVFYFIFFLLVSFPRCCCGEAVRPRRQS